MAMSCNNLDLPLKVIYLAMPTTSESHDIQQQNYNRDVQRIGTNMIYMSSSHVKTLAVTEMKMCRWTCGHALRDHVRNDAIRERLKVENITEVQESKIEVG